MEQTEVSALKHKNETPFDGIEKCGTETLCTVLQHEDLLVISLLVGSLSFHKAAALLQALPDAIRLPVIQDLARGHWESEDVLELIAADIQKKIAQRDKPPYIELGGTAFLRKIIEHGGSEYTETMLAFLKDSNPSAYEALKEHVFLFEDLAQLDDSSIQKLLREVCSTELERALKTAPPAVQEKIERNLSERAAAMLRDEMACMPPITMREVRESRQKIIRIFHYLVEYGDIVLPQKHKDNLST